MCLNAISQQIYTWVALISNILNEIRIFLERKNVFRSFESNFFLFFFTFHSFVHLHSLSLPLRNNHRQIILIVRHCFRCVHRFVSYACICVYTVCICMTWAVYSEQTECIAFLYGMYGYYQSHLISIFIMVVFIAFPYTNSNTHTHSTRVCCKYV